MRMGSEFLFIAALMGLLIWNIVMVAVYSDGAPKDNLTLGTNSAVVFVFLLILLTHGKNIYTYTEDDLKRA